MATGYALAKEPGAALQEAEGGLRYVARQPILDLRGRVYGYELLFRNGLEAAFRGDGDSATRTMIDNTVIFGLDKLTGGLPAFVNCTLETLTGEQVYLLHPSMTVLEILEDVEPTRELIGACRKLKAAGYRIALDDFVWRAGLGPLVEMADYIKLDLAAIGVEGRQDQLRRLRGAPVALVAEKVETQEEHKQARAEGFTLFQGYYFCRPELLKGRKIPANGLSHLRILELLQQDPLDIHPLSELVKRDASLTFRLLRLVNSPICAIRQEVASIESALLVVGDETFRRIATLAISSELNSAGPTEILRMTLVRARTCELSAGSCGLAASEQYLLGILSLLPAMLRTPMEELTPILPLRKEIIEALEGRRNRERALLSWIESHERGNWAACDELSVQEGLDREELVKHYTDAVAWAELALRAAA
jgi:EAL and modified HD-GYP domain-containing signal transduction protein